MCMNELQKALENSFRKYQGKTSYAFNKGKVNFQIYL